MVAIIVMFFIFSRKGIKRYNVAILVGAFKKISKVKVDLKDEVRKRGEEVFQQEKEHG